MGYISGKPRQGSEFCAMKYTRAQFKFALRYCKQHEDMLRANIYADSLAVKDIHFGVIEKPIMANQLSLQIMLVAAVTRQKLQTCEGNILTSYVIMYNWE